MKLSPFASVSRSPLPLIALVLCAACERTTDAPAPGEHDIPRAAFVGSEVCSTCHADEAAAWTGSHHDRAMEVAGPDTVLASFDDVELRHDGVTSRFYRRDGRYWVRTDGPDGNLADYEITHTFGVEPLQQYLVELPGGRRQALSLAWDSRPAELGGQRWFHLYTGQGIDHADPLHWTGALQRWNTMCADCHSTDLDKHYDVDTDTFATTWSDLDVGCEACHGPGARHAAAPAQVSLALSATQRVWVFADDSGIAQRVPALESRDEIEACAQCHARRSQFDDAHLPGEPLLDAYRPALLDRGLYHADGQMLDEVYVHGSFLQSAMYAAGVTCTDCHDPHAARLKRDGNALCGQCHSAAKYDGPEHHRHSGSGPRCVDCHMRAETYMVVDPRRDHSFRVPRPDLSARLGTPNACNDCHADRTHGWAAEAIARWYPDSPQRGWHYGEAIHAARAWAADRGALLERTAESVDVPAIARATALALLAEQPNDSIVDVLRRALDDPEPLVQLAALDAVASVPIVSRVELAQRFLTHPRKALRIAAARALTPVRADLTPSRQRDLDAAVGEHLAAQAFDADRGQGLFNLGTALAELGRRDEAETAFLRAVQREPSFVAAYINLADLYRAQGREAEAQRLLREALPAHADSADLHVALALSLVRTRQLAEALPLLERASELAPEAPYYRYLLGVALNSAGQQERAIGVLSEAHTRFPGYRETLVALATIHRDRGDVEQSARYARALLELSPSDSVGRSLLRELDNLPDAR